MQPLERLVNLVALLLDSRRPLTFEEIRERMPEGYPQEDEDSAKRMFERDKDLLRDIGVPIEAVATDAWDVERGYVIRKDRYYLPEIDFTPEEISALFVVATTGDGPVTPAEEGIRKLLYGVEGGNLSASGARTLAPTASPTEATATAAALAIAERRRVRFAYRTVKGEVGERVVDPWGLVFRAGHWYLVGRDRDRGEVRSFRLSRVSSDLEHQGGADPPPDGFVAADHVLAGPWGPSGTAGSARILFEPHVAWLAAASARGAETVGMADDGRIEVVVPIADPSWGASWVLSFGPDAEVLSPPELREETIRRLEAARAGG